MTMPKLRPTLPVVLKFAMLLSAAGLGVPGGFAQASSAAAKGTAKRKPHAGSATPSAQSTKSLAKQAPGAKAASSKAASSLGSAPKAALAHKNTASTSSRTTATRTAGKASLSRRARKQPGQKAPTSDRVSEIQTALAKDGSFAGTPGGKWDDDTTGALRKFQAAHGLSPTGKLDALTLQKLGLGSQTAGVAPPSAPPGSTNRLISSTAAPSVAAPSRTTETARRQ